MKHTSWVQLQKQAILERLANLKPSKWKLERAIWRAGELRIKEAQPLLVNLIGTDTPLRDYCTAWALGLCGSSEFVPALLNLYNSDAPKFVKRITFEALLKLADTETITNLKLKIINNLPQQTQIIARTTSGEIFTQFSLEHPYYFYAVFDQLYQLDNEYVRPALLNILRTAPFEPNYFRPIRRIFKIAEYRCDAEVFAILAYRFERTPGNFDNTLPANEWNEEQGKHLADKRRVYSNELQQDEPSFVYSYQTQQYLRRRVWRTLKVLGEIGGADYIKMATAVLLEYSDTDTPPVRRSSFDKWDYYQRDTIKYISNPWDKYIYYRYRNRYYTIQNEELVKIDKLAKLLSSNFNKWYSINKCLIELNLPWNAYADYLTFNHILYTNSQRYQYYPKGWCRHQAYKLADGDSQLREEAFPELWQQHPEALLQLLLNSNCSLVHSFAVKALRTCKEFCNSLDIEIIKNLISSNYDFTAAFGFELALHRYNSSNPSQELFTILANRLFQPKPNPNYSLIIENHQFILYNCQFITALLTSPKVETRYFIFRLLSSYILESTTASLLATCIIRELLSLSLTQLELAQEITEVLSLHFSASLRHLSLDILFELLKHPIPVIREFALVIYWNHEIRNTQEVSEGESVLAPLDNIMRLYTIQHVGKLNDENLIEYQLNTILQVASHPISEIRNLILPILQKIDVESSNLSTQIACKIIDNLLDENSEDKKDVGISLTRKRREQVNKYLFDVLQKHLQAWKTNISKETLFKLLNANLFNFRELASVAMFEQSQKLTNDFSTEDIIKLAECKIPTIRKAAQQIFLHSLERIRRDTEEIIKSLSLLNSQWCDTKEFGFNIFASHLKVEELTPKILVMICENKSEQVRALGFKLINNFIQNIQQQAEINLTFSIETAVEFIQSLLTLDKHPRLYKSIINTLQENLANWITHIDKNMILQILQAKSSTVQELAVSILNSNLKYFTQELTTNEIITIANHDIIAVREIGRQLFSQNLDNFRNHTYEMLNAVRILESKWQDTRDFGFKIFTTELSAHEITPSVLIRICDSTIEEVRKLGRDLLTRNNQGADSEEYLLKFSEHPSSDMQMFVTNYLETHASDNPQHLHALIPYFNTVLSSVNRNRGAKKRIFSFLEKEAHKSESAAIIITEIMQRQAVTMAIGDKSTAIQILLKIKKAYPHLNLPITIQDVVEERRKRLTNP